MFIHKLYENLSLSELISVAESNYDKADLYRELLDNLTEQEIVEALKPLLVDLAEAE